jgi:hypothetical protein
MNKQFNDLAYKKERGLYLNVINFSRIFEKEINI